MKIPSKQKMSETSEPKKNRTNKEKFVKPHRNDIFKEFLYAGIGCFGIIFILLALPSILWQEIYLLLHSV